MYESVHSDIQMAITGDSLITRAMSVFREERWRWRNAIATGVIRC